MKLMSDFIKIFIWLGALALLRFFVEYWISTQSYSLYATLTGIFFFVFVVYVSYKVIKV